MSLLYSIEAEDLVHCLNVKGYINCMHNTYSRTIMIGRVRAGRGMMSEDQERTGGEKGDSYYYGQESYRVRAGLAQ